MAEVRTPRKLLSLLLFSLIRPRKSPAANCSRTLENDSAFQQPVREILYTDAIVVSCRHMIGGQNDFFVIVADQL